MTHSVVTLYAKPSHTAAVWSIHNLATRWPHAVPNYLPVLTAAVCYVLTEKATVITTNLQASVRTQAMLLACRLMAT